jgi:hypothetical protein
LELITYSALLIWDFSFSLTIGKEKLSINFISIYLFNTVELVCWWDDDSSCTFTGRVSSQEATPHEIQILLLINFLFNFSLFLLFFYVNASSMSFILQLHFFQVLFLLFSSLVLLSSIQNIYFYISFSFSLISQRLEFNSNLLLKKVRHLFYLCLFLFNPFFIIFANKRLLLFTIILKSFLSITILKWRIGSQLISTAWPWSIS